MTAPVATPRTHLQVGRWRFSAMELLITIALLFFITPVVQGFPHGRAIESVLMTGVLLAAVLAVGGNRRTLLIAVILVAPALAARWLRHFYPQIVTSPTYYLPALAFLGFVIAKLLQFVLRAEQVDLEVLCASISAYLLLGILWAFAYSLESCVNAAAFAINVPGAPDKGMEGFNSLYFSFVTLSTVGYGDITPVSRTARMLAITEAMTGMLYVAVLIARLVALYSTPPQRPTNHD